MSGLFDDLIGQNQSGPTTPRSGLFDDLVPAEPSVDAPGPEGRHARRASWQERQGYGLSAQNEPPMQPTGRVPQGDTDPLTAGQVLSDVGRETAHYGLDIGRQAFDAAREHDYRATGRQAAEAVSAVGRVSDMTSLRGIGQRIAAPDRHFEDDAEAVRLSSEMTKAIPRTGLELGAGILSGTDALERQRRMRTADSYEEGREALDAPTGLKRAADSIRELTREGVLAPDEDYADHFGVNAVGAVTSMATFVGPAIAARAFAGAAAGRLGAGAAGQRAAQTGAQWTTAGSMAGTSGVDERLERYEQFLEENPHLDRDKYWAIATAHRGIPPGVVQILNLNRIIGPMIPAGRAVGQRKLADLGVAGLSEFAVEGGGALMQNLEEMGYNPDRELFDDVLQRGGYGFLAAVVMRMGMQPYVREGVGRNDLGPNEIMRQFHEGVSAEEIQAKVMELGDPASLSEAEQRGDFEIDFAFDAAPPIEAGELSVTAEGQPVDPHQAYGIPDGVTGQRGTAGELNLMDPSQSTPGPEAAAPEAAPVTPEAEQAAPEAPTPQPEAQQNPGAVARPADDQDAVQYLTTPARPDVRIPRVMVPAGELQIDARAYQYKEGADAEGVTDRLQGVKRWDDLKAGRIVVHERADGTRYVADGHQRLGLARRMEAEGHDPVSLDAIVLRETDGFTVEDARTMAATKNIAEGTGTAWDAAKIFRESGGAVLETLPPNSAIVRDGQRLANLSEEATQAAINADIDPAYAGIAASRFDDPTEQLAAIQALIRFGPTTQGQAHALMEDLAAAGVRTDQSDMFGGLDDSVMQERMRIIDRVRSRVLKDRAIMAGLVRNQETIEGSAQNVVDQQGSDQARQEAETIARLIRHISTNPELNQYVTEQARQVADGEIKRGEAIRSVLERSRASIRDSAPVDDGQGPQAVRAPDEAGAQDSFLTQPEVLAETAQPAEQQADAFGAPTESAQGAADRQAEVDARLQGQGAPDMLQGEGELFAGPRPEQADLTESRPDQEPVAPAAQAQETEPAPPQQRADQETPETPPESGVSRTVDQAAAQTDTDPSDAQVEAGNYRKGHVSLHGLDITIENPRGSMRRGTDRDGREWEQELAHHYGYIRRTNGADGDQVDVFLGPLAEDASAPVFIINQVDPRTGEFDEHKVMIGFATEADAREGYLANYEDGWQGLGAVQQTDLDAFKGWLEQGDQTQPSQPIEDFGETLHGARKHYAEQLQDAADPTGVPLSKSWPEPNYQKMISDGLDPATVGLVRALRDEVPAKPRSKWKLDRWASQVKELRDSAILMLTDADYAQRFRDAVGGDPQMRRLVGRAELYERYGHGKSLKGISLDEQHYSLYKGEENVTKWIVQKKAASTMFSNMPAHLAVGNTKQEALEAFDAVYARLGAQTGRQVRFDAYKDRQTGDFFVGKKVGRDVVRVKTGFSSFREVREYMADHQQELEQILKRMKDIPAHRSDTNAPRVGIDHRNGQDATPQMFEEAFGFRGVQFGNWVEQGRRQQDLNRAYDALMDLAGVIGVPSRALSLNGELGLAFGARGRGGKNAAAAHYEPDHIVINLTKREGAGSLAHEWWHALDNYFGRQRGDAEFVTDQPGRPPGEMRPEVAEAFKQVVAAIRRSGMPERSRNLDTVRTKDYWTLSHELSARAFESYVIEKLKDQQAANDYLANVVDNEVWEAAAALGFEQENSYPYPTSAEMPDIRAAFDSFWQVVETREEGDNVLLYSRADAPGVQTWVEFHGFIHSDHVGEVNPGRELLPVVREKMEIVRGPVSQQYKFLGLDWLDSRNEDLVEVMGAAISDLVDSGFPLAVVESLNGFMYADAFIDPGRAGFHARSYAAVGARDDIMYHLLENPGDMEAHQIFRTMMAHEMAHRIDVGSATGTRSVSETSPLFELDVHEDGVSLEMGEVMSEMYVAYLRGTEGLGEMLRYPFDHVDQAIKQGNLRGNTRLIEMVQRELFAQVAGLYYTRPESLRQASPRAWQMMEEINDAYRNASESDRGPETFVAAAFSVQKAFRVPAADVSDALDDSRAVQRDADGGTEAGRAAEGLARGRRGRDERGTRLLDESRHSPDEHLSFDPTKLPGSVSVVGFQSDLSGDALMEGLDGEAAAVYDPTESRGVVVNEHAGRDAEMLALQQSGYSLSLEDVVGRVVSRRLERMPGSPAGIFGDEALRVDHNVQNALRRARLYLRQEHGIDATDEQAAWFLQGAATTPSDRVVVRPASNPDSGRGRGPGDPIPPQFDPDLPRGASPRLRDKRGRGLVWTRLFESAADNFEQTTGLEYMGQRIRDFFDGELKYKAEAMNVIRDALRTFNRMSRSDRQKTESAFGRYFQAATYDGDVQAAYDSATPEAKALIDAWKRVGELTGEMNQELGVQVKDDNQWRLIGKVEDYFPRMLSDITRATLANPSKHPEHWDALVDALMAEGRISSRDQAEGYIRAQQTPADAQNDFFSAMEMARKQALPAIFYDWTLTPALNYINAWATRYSQIEQFGQQTDTKKDAFDEALDSGILDESTRRYIAAAQRRVYEYAPTNMWQQTLATLNMIATGSQLANFGTATLNLIGGSTLNWMTYGEMASIKAYAELIRNPLRTFRDMRQIGVLREDVLKILQDHGTNDQVYKILGIKSPINFSRGLAKAVNLVMKYGGYLPTEHVIRMHGALAGKHYLLAARKAYAKNPKSRKSKQFQAFIERNNFDFKRLMREDGDYFEKWLRFTSNLTQGTYRIDQTPIFADVPEGRFFLKYQKFGTQVNRLVWKESLEPFVKSVAGRGEKLSSGERVRTFWPMVRVFYAAAAGGAAIGTMRQMLFDYMRPGPQEDELEKALEDDDRSRKLAILFAYGYHQMNMAGAFGFLGNYGQMFRDFTQQERVKNPLDPPGLAALDAAAEIAIRLVGQKQYSVKDLDETLERFFALYRTSKRPLIKAIGMMNEEQRLYKIQSAERDRKYIAGVAARYAKDQGIEGARSMISGRFMPTERTPVAKRVIDAIRAGDPMRAEEIFLEASDHLDAEEYDKFERSIRASVRNAQPMRMHGKVMSRRQVDEFLEWAEQHVGDENFQRIIRAHEEYLDHASGFM